MVSVSGEIMRDLLTCKSKLTDVRHFALQHEAELKHVEIYDELMKILKAAGYTEEGRL